MSCWLLDSELWDKNGTSFAYCGFPFRRVACGLGFIHILSLSKVGHGRSGFLPSYTGAQSAIGNMILYPSK